MTSIDASDAQLRILGGLTIIRGRCMNLSTLGLLFVIFVDVSGQGLILPIINTLVMDPSTGLLPANAAVSERHFSYGLVIGAFYLSWFLGAVCVSKISDGIVPQERHSSPSLSAAYG